MGSRTSDTLKEIESLREGLDAKLVELEKRIPALRLSRKTVAVAFGSGTGGAVLWFAVRKLRARDRADRKAPVTPAPVVVNVLPKGTLPAAVAVAGIWAGVRLLEAKLRSAPAAEQDQRPAAVTELRRGSAP